jgi:hypothetical protein
MPFFSSFTGSFAGGRRTVAGGGGTGVVSVTEHIVNLQPNSLGRGNAMDPDLSIYYELTSAAEIRRYPMSPDGDWTDIDYQNNVNYERWNHAYSEGTNMIFSADGLTMFTNTTPGFTPNKTARIDKWVLTTPFDIKSGSVVQNTSISTGGGLSSSGLGLSSDGTRLVWLTRLPTQTGTYASRIIDLSTPYDLSTATWSAAPMPTAAAPLLTQTYASGFIPDGSKLIMAQSNGANYFFSYHDLTTPFDITTATNEVVMDTTLSSVDALWISPAGDRMVARRSTARLLEYELDF